MMGLQLQIEPVLQLLQRLRAAARTQEILNERRL
jgi:hypothetical protein